MPHTKKKLYAIAPLMVASLCAVAIWSVFYPAIMSADSIDYYEQALTGRYHDWQPPLVALVLHAVMRLNGSLGLLTLIQCFACCLGVLFLGGRVMKRIGVSGQSCLWLSLAVFAMLISPLSPLPFLMMTFWKDVWIAILMALFICVSDWCYERMNSSAEGARWTYNLILPTLCLTIFFTRHNALALAPVFFVVLWQIGRRSLGNVRALLIPLLILGLYLVMRIGIYQAFDIERRHPEEQVMALDLVGMLARWPHLKSELPYTASHLRPDYKERYRTADIAPLYWEKPLIVDIEYVRPSWLPYDWPEVNNEMRREYRQAILSHPLQLSAIKIEAWWALLHPRYTHHLILGVIIPNKFDLAQSHVSILQRIREKAILIERRIFSSSIIKWTTGSHLLWLLMNVCWLLYCAVARRGKDRFFEVCLLAIPLTYSLSYMLAAPARDFRFMYPSTLMVQVLTLGFAVSWVWRRICHRHRP